MNTLIPHIRTEITNIIMDYFSSFVIILSGFVSILVGAQDFTLQKNPIIKTISPYWGGIEGGTMVTITGANFKPSVLFTEAIVFIGNEVCEIDNYHSSDVQIVCFTPKCYSSDCTAKKYRYYDYFASVSAMAVTVCVQSVSGVPCTVAPSYLDFWYYEYWTPNLYAVSQTTWGTATTAIVAYVRSQTLTDITIKVGRSSLILGSNLELNPNTFYFWSSETQFYARVPEDCVSGFQNISLSVQNDQSNGYVGTGFARTFQNDRFDYWEYSRFYLYSSNLQGTSYSSCILPTITAVNPSRGSIAGGTVMRIKGTGFSYLASHVTVFVGGLLCDITSVSAQLITCITRAAVSDQTSFAALVNNPSLRSVFGDVIESPRKFGSQGWWIKMWNYDDYWSDTTGLEVSVKLSFGWRDRFYLSFYDKFGYNWPSISGFGTSYYFFSADAASVFTAPYSGFYTFYVSADDSSKLYMSKIGIGKSETLVAFHDNYVPDQGNFYSIPTQISSPIPLRKNEKLYLRCRFVNTGGNRVILIG